MSEVSIGGDKRARRGYEIADVDIVPRRRTRARELVDIAWQLDAYRLELPLLSAPLDAVTSPRTAVVMAELGGLGVLNLEGLWTRYDDPAEVFAEIASLAPGPEATQTLQRLYHEPVRPDLIGKRVEELKAGGYAAAALSPQKVERYHGVALEAGLDLLVVNGVVTTAQHVGTERDEPLDLRSFTARYDIPVVVGGVASAKSALHLMRTGAVGVLVGVGTSAASTTRPTLGVSMPQATAVAEVASARNRYLGESGRYVQVIAAAGIETGGDIARAIACGADAVMLGVPLARASEAPGGGNYWGLASAHHELPRGGLIRVGQRGSLERIVSGPADREDGTANLIGALKRAMVVTGYEDLRALQRAELVVRS